MDSPSICLCVLLLGGLSGAVMGQSTISPVDRYAHAANAGWLEGRPAAADGIRVTDTTLSGYAWAANFGWVHCGNGNPANGHAYSNINAADYGVNLSLDGFLTGYAYAANAGWISFEQTHGQPRLDLRTGKFSGAAYAANLGWIALDTVFSDLITSTLSRPDTDGDGMSDAWENLQFGNLTSANAATDRDGDGASDLAEYLAGTSPLDPGSSLRILSHTYASGFTQATLQFTSVPSRFYRVEFATDLTGLWTNSALGTFPAGTSPSTANLTGLPAAPRRFFRVAAIALPSAP